LVRVDGPGLRSVKECCQDDGLVHLQFGVQVNTVVIPHGGLQPAEGLTSFGDPLGNLLIDSRVAW
uniref:ABC transporter ATP-binding protein n=1 Tax=Schistocephalus solidus TaxID=70667 RepID=A0A183TCT9_SCHSO